MSDVTPDRDSRSTARAHEVAVEARRTLADVLRHDLGYTGTHLGCEHGICGACTVLVDGAADALVPDVRRAGRRPRGRDGRGPRRRRRAARRCSRRSATHHGLQCGFCTPGFLMLATALLRENPEPDRRRRSARRGVEPVPLHRLPGHRRGRAATPRDGAAERPRHDRLIGTPLPRAARTRACCAARGRFVDDVDRPGQLWTRVVRSAVAHAPARARSTPRRRATAPGVARGRRPPPTSPDVPAHPGPARPVRAADLDALPAAGARAATRPLRRRAGRRRASPRTPTSPRTPPSSSRRHTTSSPVLDAACRAATARRAARRRGNDAPLQRGYGDVDARVRARRRTWSRSRSTSAATPACRSRRAACVAELRPGARRADDLGRDEGAALQPRRARRPARHAARALIRCARADAGGGFGVRGELYPEDVLVPWLARRARPPGEVDRGPRRAPRRGEPLAPAAPPHRGRVRRRRRAARPARRRSGTTTAPTCAPTASSCRS